MKVTFLGTGTSTGVPVIGCHCATCVSGDIRDKRSRSSVMVEVDKKTLMIDCGPDFREQMLRNRFENIDAILLTHSHRDHIAGLDDVRTVNYQTRKKIKLYCNALVLEELKQIYFYAFSEKRYPGIPEWDIHLIDNKKFEAEGVSVTPIDCMHGDLPIQGFRIGNFAYLTDLNAIAEKELSKLAGLDVLVLDALRMEPHHSHFSLEEAIEMAHRIRAKQTYFTHICHHMPPHAVTEKRIPASMQIAHDGLSIVL